MSEINDIQIFISYASPDQERVLSVYEFLIKSGFPNAWIDCKKLLPGQSWELEIQRNLRKSEIVIIFLSHTSVNKRGFVQRELKATLKYLEEKLSDDIYIIPIKLDADVMVPDELQKIQYLDINQPSALFLLKQSLEAQTEKLGFKLSQESIDLDKIHIIKRVVREQWEGLPGYEVDYAVPIFHSTEFENIAEVTKLIEASFIRRLQFHRKDKLEQYSDSYSYAQGYYQRTNTFDARYQQVFFQNSFLSILYEIYWYGAGAAHPNRHFETFNFLLNPLIQIESFTDVFQEPDVCFQKIVSYVRTNIGSLPVEGEEDESSRTTQDLLDSEWVERGTSSWESFNAFSFSREGIQVSFAPYQIAAYAVGSFHLTIPYSYIKDDLKPYIKHAISIW